MNALSLTLFGQSQVRLNNRAVMFRTKKAQALLIYLVAEPGTHRRDILIELLWPGMPERSARQNLRQTIFNLRQALPEQVASNNGDDDTEVVLLQTNRKSMN